MEEKRDEILAERRAKLARLRGELSVQDRDITSAPSLTVVDEFQEEFSSADKRSGVIDKGEPQQQRNHTIFYAEQGARKESDLEFNKLVSEASRRGGKGAEQKGNDFGSGSTFAEDTDLDDELDGYTVSRSKSAGPVRSQTEGFPAGLSNQFEGGKSFNLGSSITKVYQNGKYINSTEDLGYQSSVSSPDETKRRQETQLVKQDRNLLRIERGVDTFSQSLPETFLKSVKVDLSQSTAGLQDRNQSKVVYDPRIFGGGQHLSRDVAAEAEGVQDDVEKEYFEKMNKMNGKEKSTFKEFLNQSFKEGAQTQDCEDRGGRLRPNLTLAPVSELRVEDGEPSPLECIDLGDPTFARPRQGTTIRSPTLSCRTEFTDPDSRGRSAQRPSSRAKGLAGLMARKFKKKSRTVGQPGQPLARKRRPSGSINESEFGESWRYGSGGGCETCSHRRTTSCYGVLALLAIDIFTIGLILILFNKIYRPPQGLGYVQARQGDIGQDPGQDTVPHHGQQYNQTQSQPQYPDVIYQEPETKSIEPRSLEPRSRSDPDLEARQLEDLKEQLENLTKQVNSLMTPPTFSCHRTKAHRNSAMVTYDQCSITTAGMNAATGRFTAQQDGVYQLTFTALFVAIRGHMLSADLYLEQSGSEPQIIGRSSAMVKEDTVFGRDDDLHATSSVIVLQRLKQNDEVYVSMHIDGNHGDSHLMSDFSKKIHFTGLKIAA